MSWRSNPSQNGWRRPKSSSTKTTPSQILHSLSRPRVSSSSRSRSLVELSDNEDIPPVRPSFTAQDKGKEKAVQSSSQQGIASRTRERSPALPPIPIIDLSKDDDSDNGETLRDLQLQSELKLHAKLPSSRFIARSLGESSRKRDAQRAQLANAEAFKRAREDGSMDMTNGQGSTKEVAIEYQPMPDLGPLPPLTAQQQSILDRIVAGESMFFTGSAGSGKSVLLRAIIRAFRRQDEDHRRAVEDGKERPYEGRVQRWKLAVTASTGMAAINIGGRTLHCWSGIGLGVEPVGILIAKAMKSKCSQDNWRTTHTLIIDEISMIDGKLLDKLDAMGKALRRSQAPFGGLQVILTGDFHQLPPVAKRGDQPATFAFESLVWPKLIPTSNMARLTQVFRQHDMDFVIMLEEMRKGKVSMISEKELKALDRPLKYDDGVVPTELYPSVAEVNAVNSRQLAKLTGVEKPYKSFDVAGTYPSCRPVDHADAVRQLNEYTKWPEEITLKIGAIVMLVTNLSGDNLVNGSVGKVVAFISIQEAEAQGVLVVGEGDLLCPKGSCWPVVEFIPSKYACGPVAKRTLVTRMKVDHLNGAAEMQAQRVQVPLILAWALTIHKSQGQTLERVKVDLDRIFAEGQTYVALSRAVDMAGLEVKNFSKWKVRASPRVLAWARAFEEEG